MTAGLRPPSGRASPALHPPLTPSPIPATNPLDATYANPRAADAGPSIHTCIWGENEDGGDAFTVFEQPSFGEDPPAWVAVYKLDVAVGEWFPGLS